MPSWNPIKTKVPLNACAKKTKNAGALPNGGRRAVSKLQAAAVAGSVRRLAAGGDRGPEAAGAHRPVTEPAHRPVTEPAHRPVTVPARRPVVGPVRWNETLKMKLRRASVPRCVAAVTVSVSTK